MTRARKQLLLDVRQRPVTFIPSKKSLSRVPGDWPSPHQGKGFEPMGQRDFELGDDPRRISLVASARRGTATIVERVALREFNIMVVVDESFSMRIRRKWDIQAAAAMLLLYSAWKAETTFSLGVRTESGLLTYGLGIGSRHFYRLSDVLWHFVSEARGERPAGRLQVIHRCLPANSMLFYCSDFLDKTGNAIALHRLAPAIRRYDFVPIIVQDRLEHSFPQISTRTSVPVVNPETHAAMDVRLTPAIADSIRTVHEERFDDLIHRFRQRGAIPIHLATENVVQMSRQIDTYFRSRDGF